MTELILSAVQYKPPKGDPVIARRELAELAEEACSRDGSRFVVFPEMATCGYVWSSREEILPFTEQPAGETFRTLSAVAKKHAAWLVCGYAERDGDDLYNSSMIIDDTGRLAANYRKCCLYDDDRTWAREGNTRISVITPYGMVTPGICMDANDDGFIDYARGTGSTVIPFCTNWIDEGLDVHEYWRKRFRGFGGAFIAADTWGTDHGIKFYGRSAIMIGGKIVAEAPEEGNGIISAEIALSFRN
ncbi:MAG TPA: carbon-nitrogen hydrolase family protein [Spirochaetota bacterium]|nr:carbon-nitrogen hydrolase family protein [Spirochaetota bacterium]